jgi:hypothetical protein
LNDIQHRDVASDTSKRYARGLLVDIAWKIPQDAPWTHFHDMDFHDRVNFCEVYLKHAAVRDFLTQKYQTDALYMQRIIMSITEELLDEGAVT